MDTTVAILRADKYDEALILEKIRALFACLGGAESFIRPGQTVLVKPNLIAKARPAESITTHPAVVSAICKIVRSCGATALIAESPACPYTPQALAAYYDACGITAAAKESGATLNLDCGTQSVSVSGTVVREMPVIRPVLTCDCIISAAKLKTHALTTYTGATKNMFGIVPGYHKAQFHAKYAKDTFFDALLDVCAYAKPVISIIDGVWGMEGDGPTAGKAKKTGILLASKNPYAADLAAAAMVGLDFRQAPMIVRSIQRGLCPSKPEDLKLLGDFEKLTALQTYQTPRQTEHPMLRLLPSPLKRLLLQKLAPFPIFTDLCVGCGNCAEICPAKAITLSNHKAQADKQRCIKCYCCQEICPFKAVKL